MNVILTILLVIAVAMAAGYRMRWKGKALTEMVLLMWMAENDLHLPGAERFEELCVEAAEIYKDARRDGVKLD